MENILFNTNKNHSTNQIDVYNTERAFAAVGSNLSPYSDRNQWFRSQNMAEDFEPLRAASSASVLSLSFIAIAIQVNYCILLFPISVTI